MNNFLIEEEKPVTKTNTLWVEKYRPTQLEEYIGNENLKNTIKSFIDKRDIPHLLLYGPAGGGKTSAAKLITKNIPCDVMYINASDENGVDVVRNKIKGFASTAGFTDLKIIVLDECDFLSQESQAALRNLMETFSLTTRFILTCNYIEKIISPLTSRCQTYQINPMSKKDVALHLKSILDKENITFTVGDLGFIVNTYYPDIRKIINFSQQSVDSGKIKISSHDVVGIDTGNKIIECIKSSTNTVSSFTSIRQIVADGDIKMFDELYSLLYAKITEYSRGKDIPIIITIAEYLHQSCLVVDKEITFMACIAAILKQINEKNIK